MNIEAPDVIVSLMAEAEAAPDELSIIANMMTAPPMPGIPEDTVGQPVIMVMMVYAGDVEAGERAIAPIRGLAAPIAGMVRTMRYPEIFAFTEGDIDIKGESAHSMFVDSVDHSGAAATVDHLKSSTAPIAVAQLRALGGAMARVPVDATAFAHRQRRILVAVGAVYDDLDETPLHEACVNSLVANLNRGDAGVYVGFLGDEGESRVHEASPQATWDRLAAIKARYDPDNLFRLNQNVPRLSETANFPIALDR